MRHSYTLTNLPGTAPEDLVSLTMPVSTESYVWDDQLPPVFQMNLPEGYLLQVLQEQFGPQFGASPTALLSVIRELLTEGLEVRVLPAEPSKINNLEISTRERFCAFRQEKFLVCSPIPLLEESKPPVQTLSRRP